MNHSLLNPNVSKYWTLPSATLGFVKVLNYRNYIVTGNMFETYNLFLIIKLKILAAACLPSNF